jgi:hypothetical protein
LKTKAFVSFGDLASRSQKKVSFREGKTSRQAVSFAAHCRKGEKTWL